MVHQHSVRYIICDQYILVRILQETYIVVKVNIHNIHYRDFTQRKEKTFTDFRER